MAVTRTATSALVVPFIGAASRSQNTVRQEKTETQQ